MRLVGLAVLAASMFYGPAATAATVSHDGTRIYINGEPGERNVIEISSWDCDVPCLRISEDGVSNSITLDAATESSQRCIHDPISTFAHYVVYCEWAPTTIDVGDGDDHVTGGPTSDTIAGGPGHDQLIGGDASDSIDGGSGDDKVDNAGFSATVGTSAYNGADDLRGGDGNDLVSYYPMTSPLTISVDDQANDPGGDNVHSDVEQVEGGAADDTITGNEGANKLFGSRGTDIISGRGGNDDLNGDIGIDQLSGDAGNDTVNGGSNGDVIDGGAGVDSLVGDTSCESAGCGGPDRINARDGEGDNVVCRDDADTVQADSTDAVAGDCEMVERGGGTDIGEYDGGGGDGNGPAITGALSGRAPRIGKALKSGVTLAYSCNEACGISGQAVVSGKDAHGLKLAKTVVVARGTSAVGQAGRGKLKLKFTRKARKMLRSRKKLKLKVTLVAVDGAGNPSTLKRTITLKR
jgi:Ca2+-binding RTX toxin-like protein